jgi:hypothetical protein
VKDDVSCSALSATLHEPLAGTAARALTWLCIEQPGPYGADALVESHLDRAVGAELVRRATGTGVRIQLIRRPGRHADDHRPLRRRVILAHTRPGATWLRSAEIADLATLLDLDLAAAGAGDDQGFGHADTRPTLLVCTNGRRDVCCALRGRPIAEALVARSSAPVWETTHTGGHRFAPTAVLLPWGYAYGRLDVDFCTLLLARSATGQVVSGRCRGRSTWSPPGQVAELAVRERLSAPAGPDELTVAAERWDGSDWEARVTATSGRAWLVRGCERQLTPARRTSCVKAPVRPAAQVVTDVREVETSTGRR